MRSFWINIAVVTMLLAFPQGATASWYWPFGKDGMDYAVHIQGEDSEMDTWFATLQLDRNASENPPHTMDELDQLGMRRGNQLREALKAKGYYDAQVDYRLNASATPPVLIFQVTQGTRYRIASVRLAWDGGAIGTADLTKLPVQEGQFADADAINKEAEALSATIGKNACLLSLSVTPVLQLDGSAGKATLLYRIKHGPRANFGEPVIKGNQKVHDTAIARLLAWKRGECFTDAKIAKTRTTLIGMQLFSTVKVTPGTTVDAKGEVPITIEVTERVERTVSIGGNYATDQGFGVKLGWEHRNFLGDAEKVDANAVIAEQEQSLTLTERDPGFRRDDQALVVSGAISRQDTDAYTSQSLNGTVSVERRFSPHLNGSGGVGYLLTRSNDPLEGNQNFGLLSAPFFADYDSRDDAQDAHKGLYVHLALTPYVDTFDINTEFFKGLATGQTYFSSDIKGKPTLALRGSLGTIDGAASTSLPSNLRFYAGGGGSVRGYSYQSLSPRFQGTPIGGGSLIELSAELRVHFTESFGAVAFLDGGNAYAAQLPNFSNPLYYGAGAGLRYYSPLGPLRVDLGFPLNGHDINGSGVDASGFQVYVGLGQAF